MSTQSPVEKAVDAAIALEAMFQGIPKAKKMEYIGDYNQASLDQGEHRNLAGIDEAEFQKVFDAERERLWPTKRAGR